MTMRAMRCQTALAALVFTVTLPSMLGAQTTGVEIEVSHNTSGEQSEAARLRRMLGQFDLAPWLFTRRVVIDEQTAPHSHPVLTVGYGDHGDDNLLLSNFVHEQLHWWLVGHQQQTDGAISELRQLFPKLPVGGLDGAVNEESSYLHLLVIWLEWQGDKALLGEKKAAEVMAFWKDDHYRVLYRTVLDSEDVIGGVVAKHGLTCCLSR
jgi:hypothetical protein